MFSYRRRVERRYRDRVIDRLAAARAEAESQRQAAIARGEQPGEMRYEKALARREALFDAAVIVHEEAR